MGMASVRMDRARTDTNVAPAAGRRRCAQTRASAGSVRASPNSVGPIRRIVRRIGSDRLHLHTQRQIELAAIVVEGGRLVGVVGVILQHRPIEVQTIERHRHPITDPESE